MLKRLQQKFIMTNMVLVGLVLGVVFVLFYMNTYSATLFEIDAAMRRSVEFVQASNLPLKSFNTNATTQPAFRPNNTIPTLTVTINSSGTIVQTYQDLTTLPTDDIKALSDAALSQKATKGQLRDRAWRFFKASHQGDTYLAFASTSPMTAKMHSTLLISLVLASGSMVVFFFISLIMAKFSISPVKRAWKQQQQFVTDASHELKTPLTVILANNNILLSKQNVILPWQEKWLQSTQAEATHMKALIDNMLSLARATSCSTSIPMARICLSDICTHCVLQFEPVAFEKNVTLTTDIENNLYISGNSTEIKQLAHILMDNACKYSNSGDLIHGILKKSGSSISMSVNNNGTCIEPHALPHIFERFYRSDEARTQENGQGGYGLGLSIAKNIVDRHNGKITVHSTPTDGTTFTVLFKNFV